MSRDVFRGAVWEGFEWFSQIIATYTGLGPRHTVESHPKSPVQSVKLSSKAQEAIAAGLGARWCWWLRICKENQIRDEMCQQLIKRWLRNLHSACQ